MQRVELGWAETLKLDGETRLKAASGVFRAVVFPTGDPAELTCTAEGRAAVSWNIDKPTAIECEARGGELVLSTDQQVELLRPRWADPRYRGKRRIMIVADTLRYDHANATHMPEIDARFADGVRFDRAYSAAAWTLPSVAALFTGRRPVELRAPDGTLISLPASLETLAEDLASAGEMPIAVVANPTVSHENGYAQGFGLFVAPPASASLGGDLPDASWVNEHALRAAEWFPDLDLFFYLQYMEAHGPYRNHETGEVLPAPTTGGPEPSPDDLTALRAAYSSEARYLSRQLDQLFEALGPLELAVFTADHGEELFDHGGFGHGPALWHEVVQVPLWIRGTGLEAGVVDWPVSLTQLKAFLVGADKNLLERPPRWVSSESFVHGPPRWAAFQGPRRITWFARQPNQQVPTEPVAAWLAANHPLELIESPADLEPPKPERLRAALHALAGQFHGLRKGLFLFVAEAELDVSASGVAGEEILIWGQPSAVTSESLEEGQIRLRVQAKASGVLVFMPALDQQEIAIEAGNLKVAERAPLTLPAQGTVAWSDPGRPPAQLQGIEETLERLRALGYI